MRLWSFHPKYLDSKGLVALWREGLLAKAVLEGKTKGYMNHPQLVRFKKHNDPIEAINAYLNSIADEAELREYDFNRNKLSASRKIKKIKVTTGQAEYEFKHLNKKLNIRDKSKHKDNIKVKKVEPHPLIEFVDGEIESWEKSD